MPTARHTAPLLEVQSLSKHYGPVAALDGVSCGVRDGEILGLIGPNGAGKTTLFECLAGVRPATRGTVRSRGAVVDLEARRTLLFYLPDNVRPWPSETVRWALTFAAGYLGAAGAADSKTPDLGAVIESLRLEPLLRKRMRELSKGECKRVLLAIGLSAPQPVLLADEPFEGLDLRQSREVAATLRTHAAGGRTLFLSIHQIGDAARVCDRFVLLSAGRVAGEGTADELIAAATAAGRAPESRDLEGAFLALT
jgi:ABC-2 type transport system ATP-binding protein